MSVEGLITLQLEVEGAHVKDAAISSTRRTDLGQKLEGKPVAEALAMVPRLFSICGAAHHVAARRAVSAARGETLEDEARDEWRCLLEALESHAFQLCVEWPRLTGAGPLVEPLRTLRREAAALRASESPDTSRLEPAVAMVKEARACLEPARALGLEQWTVQSSPLPVELEARALADLPLDMEFAARPEWEGVREAGAWSRTAAHGESVFDRLLAQLAHLDVILAALQRPRALAPFRRADGLGVGLARTSRGRLLHRVALGGDRVTAWQIIAPTEWTFHPQGVVRQALMGVPVEGLPARLPWLVAAFDPCVPVRIDWR